MRVLSLIAGVALLASVGTVPVAAENKQDFTLVNKTGYELKEVYVSPSKSDDWEEDVLGRDTLDDGETARIRFHRSSRACKWDLKVVYEEDSSSATWSDIDLCEVEKITIRYDKKRDKTTASFD